MNTRPPVTPRIFLGSLLFAIGQVAATLVVGTLAAMAFAAPYRTRYGVVVRWAHFNTWWLAKTCGLRHRVHGLENIPNTPSIILCKHQSAWETIALQHYFTPQVWVLKRELLRLPFFGWGLAALRPIAIDRSAGRTAASQVVEQGSERLESGCWVVVFPEGTRVPPGKKRRYKLGGALLAEHTGYPIVPVAHDSGHYWPRNSFIKYPGTIQLVIGKPITSRGRSAAEINRLTEEWIESTVERLYAEGAGTATPKT